MYAVIRTGGKQYRVAPNDVIEVERLEAEPGSSIELPEVLMVGGETPQVGTPLVAGASVAATVLEQGKGPKVIVFKKRRRKNSRRRTGHRQRLTVLRVTGIKVA
jgi:large subunit ribosomal protein L21